MKTRYLYFVIVMIVAVSLAIGGCGAGTGTSSNQNNVILDPNPVLPPDPQAKLLREGKEVKGTVKNDCDNSFVLEAVNKLCDLFGAGNCVNQTSSCNSFARQIYTGSVLGADGTGWNARGGSGQLMADAAICTLRELSPKVPGGGPLHTQTSPINIGIGDVVVKQEVGYLDFDRVNGRFKGYRKLRVELPVLGAFDAITQNIDLRRSYYGTKQLFSYQPYAGDYKILYGYGLDISTEEKNKSIEIKPPAFDVYTPIGIFQAQPTFKYGSNTVVADSPSGADPFVKDHTYVILPNDPDGSPAAIRLTDLYGIIPGVENNEITPPHISNYKEKRSGWVSQIGLGTRGSGSDKLWSPPSSGFFSRPDYDPFGLLGFEAYVSRSNDENLPSVYAEASAELKFPKDPKELLPDWVDDLPGPSFNAYIKVTPKVKAGAAGQFGISVSEGTNNKTELEGEFLVANPSDRLSALGIYSGVEANASFDVDAELRLYVYADFGWPIGEITFININPHFNIPLAGGGEPVGSKVELATAFSSSGDKPDMPEKLDSLKTFKGSKLPEEFINICFAKETEVPPEEPPESEAEKGNPEDLFAYMYCNICMATDAVINPNTGEIKVPAHQDILVPVNPTPPAVWQCDEKSKSGCMDLCKLNKATKEFTVVKNPSQIADSIPTSDPNYSELYAFYKSCMIPCTGVTTGLFGTSCGKGLDATPPKIMSSNASSTAGPFPANEGITASFTEPMNESSINENTFLVMDSFGNQLAGMVTYNPEVRTATFTATDGLAYSAAYTATITTGVMDAEGNALAEAYSWDFTTVAAPDTTLPVVISLNPASGSTGVPVDSTISVTFSEPIDTSTINNGSIFMLIGGETVPGIIMLTDDNTTVIFMPDVPLSNDTLYSVNVTTAVKDSAGNAISEDVVWSFTTIQAVRDDRIAKSFLP